jgi:parvulin-like peptidyl-prolyl isomerase
MKKLLPIIVFLCVWTVQAQTNTAIQTNTPPPTQSIEIDGYAAKVNDRVITIGEVREAMAPMLPELYRLFDGDELEAALRRAFQQTRDELIAQALILEAFEEKGGMIPDQYVNDEIRRIINDGFKGDEAQFEQVLASQKMSRAEYREEIRDKLIVGMLSNEEINKRARATPEEIRTYYEETKDQEFFIPEKVKYSVIALNRGETPEEQDVKFEEAAGIRQKLLEGADFADMAKDVSEGSRAAEGGEFPWMQPTDARDELQEILKALPVGEVSEIITGETQLYIVKIDARRQSGYKSFEEVRDDIKKTLLAKERQRLRERWIERMKAENYVKIYED